MSAKYQPPEGFYYDWNMSSYYHKQMEYDPSNGNPILALYVFDPLQGSTQKYTYPIDPASGAPILGDAQLPKEGAPFLQEMKKFPMQKTKNAMLAASGISLVLCIIILAILL